MERARYHFGSLTRKQRAKGSDAWEFRYYESTEKGPGSGRPRPLAPWTSTRPRLSHKRLLKLFS